MLKIKLLSEKEELFAASFFAGPHYNFGNGPRVFIDNFG
jgi:hypothetical protein